VTELLAEYERRLAGDGSITTRTATPGGTEDAASSDASLSAGNGGAKAAGRYVCRPPAVYNRDVIPSPKNSPLKTCPPLDQYIRSNKPSH